MDSIEIRGTSAPIAPAVPVVVAVADSPFASQHPIPLTGVTLTDAFWAPRIDINRTSTLPGQYRKLEESSCLDNFRRAAGRAELPFVGPYFSDSDLYKWLEAASWSLSTHPEDNPLAALVSEAIALIEGAQDKDGYLNTYFCVDRVHERWTNFDLHEMYCAGHLFQAAVAHYRATGTRRLIEIAIRLADHICARFGPGVGQRHAICGHEEIEMALVELFRVTGDRRYLNTAQYFIGARGHNLLNREAGTFGPQYFQDHIPFRELTKVTGHAVRMVYLDCGAADLYAETGDPLLKSALEIQWLNMTGRRMYVTGGLGARWEGEAFGEDYELPSATAYAETCAAIGSVMWNWRMLLATGEARYADLMERTLYNGVISGLSLDGSEYFYQNPLMNDGAHRRQAWFGCACCPPNVARMLASLSGYFATVFGSTLSIHLYAEGQIDALLSGGVRLTIDVETEYPWDGAVRLTVLEAPSTPAALRLRIPAWAEGATLAINGSAAAETVVAGAYATLERVWIKGDMVDLGLPFDVRVSAGHPAVADTSGRLSLSRGPLVYCIEQADNRGIDLRFVQISPETAWNAAPRPDLLGGVVALKAKAEATSASAWEGRLYQPASHPRLNESTPVTLTAIPYYAWANREPGYMTVWIRSST